MSYRSKTPSRIFNKGGRSVHATPLKGIRDKQIDIVDPTKQDFGVPGYIIAKHYRDDKSDRDCLNWKVYKMPERGKYTYLDDVMKISKKMIEPNKYTSSHHVDWNEHALSKMHHGHSNKDTFKKGKKETAGEEVQRIAKKKNIPAPNAY